MSRKVPAADAQLQIPGWSTTVFGSVFVAVCIAEDGCVPSCVPGLRNVFLEPFLQLSWLSVKPRMSLH